MTQWLYNSSGRPIVFIKDEKVFSRTGRFIGRLDDNEVWHSSYKGEIVKGDRFLYKINKSSVIRGIPGIPGTPGIPGLPGYKGGIDLPAGYRDIEVDD